MSEGKGSEQQPNQGSKAKKPATVGRIVGSFRPIFVMGDFLSQHVIREMQERRLNPANRAESYSDFHIITGAFLFESLSRFGLEYAFLQKAQEDKHLFLLNRKNLQDAATKVSSKVLGPSYYISVARNEEEEKRKIYYACQREHLSVAETRGKSVGRVALRINRQLGSVQSGSEKFQRDQAIPKYTIALFSIDFANFLKEPANEYFAGNTLSNLEENASSLVLRLAISPTVNVRGEEFRAICENLCGLLDGFAKKPKYTVISSGTLRVYGYDISFRKSWERTVSDLLSAVEDARAKKDGVGSDVPLERVLARAGTLVITLYNDALLIIPEQGEATFVAVPNAIERDFNSQFTGQTKGTETLVTQAIALYCSTKRKTKVGWLEEACIHGLKASRFLLAHGFVKVKMAEPQSAQVGLAKNFAKYIGNGSDAYWAVGESADNEPDSLFFTWNRTRAADFALKQLDLTSWLGTPQEFVTWPMGDLTEILMTGQPLHGSFSPRALPDSLMRERITKTCAGTVKSYSAAGWLEVTKIPFEDGKVTLLNSVSSLQPSSFSNLVDSQHEKHWWTFEDLAVERLATKLGAMLQRVNRPLNLDLTRFLLGCYIVKFGETSLHRAESGGAKKHFQVRFRNMVKDLHKEILPLAKDWSSDFEELKNHFDKKESEDAASALRLTNPSWLGIIPRVQFSGLTLSSRSEIRNFHDVKEALLTYLGGQKQRPLSIAVFGAPGSGKSFAVKKIVNSCIDNAEEIEINLASISDSRMLGEYFLRVQELSLNGKFPVVFWDEFDSEFEGGLGWLKHFLAPMQDGQFLYNGYIRKLPPCVFVFAGSRFQSTAQMLVCDALKSGDYSIFDLSALNNRNEDEYQKDLLSMLSKAGSSLPIAVENWRSSKGSDFKSRLTATYDVLGVRKPSSDLTWLLPKDGDTSRMIRGARLLRFNIEKYHRKYFTADGELLVAENVLRDLLLEEAYVHDARSIEQIMRQFTIGSRDVLDGSVVPTAALRRLHMSTTAFDRQEAGGSR